MSSLITAYALVVYPKEGRRRVLGVWVLSSWAYRKADELKKKNRIKVKGTVHYIEKDDVVKVVPLVENVGAVHE